MATFFGTDMNDAILQPQAIRTALDVYGENVRKIVPIDSPQFGRVMAVCVGAMMVGSIKTTVEEGQHVKRGDEFGYFAFGKVKLIIFVDFSLKVSLRWLYDRHSFRKGRRRMG